MTEVFSKVVDLAQALGVESINELDGCWTYQVSDKWLLKVNGHGREVDGVPAFHAYVEYNGWPAGVFNAQGGTIAGGANANEAALIAALNQALNAAQAMNQCNCGQAIGQGHLCPNDADRLNDLCETCDAAGCTYSKRKC